MLVAQMHNGGDIANNAHRNGTYEGFSYESPMSFLKSFGAVVKHMFIDDVFPAIANWNQRVDNVSTIIQGYLKGEGAQYTYDQGGKVSATQSQSLQSLNPPPEKKR